MIQVNHRLVISTLFIAEEEDEWLAGWVGGMKDNLIVVCGIYGISSQ